MHHSQLISTSGYLQATLYIYKCGLVHAKRELSCILLSLEQFAGIRDERARAKSSFIHRKYEREATHNFIIVSN